jgi:hypothetical protein
LFKLLPPLLPCGGLTGGVLPEPPETTSGELEPPAPPEPPEPPTLSLVGLTAPPPPPPAEVIVLKTELLPALEVGLGETFVQFEVPPLPTVIGKDVAVTVTDVPPGFPFKGLAV